MTVYPKYPPGNLELQIDYNENEKTVYPLFATPLKIKVSTELSPSNTEIIGSELTGKKLMNHYHSTFY